MKTLAIKNNILFMIFMKNLANPYKEHHFIHEFHEEFGKFIEHFIHGFYEVNKKKKTFKSWIL